MGEAVKHKCNERIWRERWGGRCSNTALHDPDANGAPTKCGIHCASAKAKRQAKFDAAMAARRAVWDRSRAIGEAKMKLIPALRQIAAGCNDPRALATQVLAELDAASGGTYDDTF